MKKENLNIKLANDGYRDVLDITSDLKTEHESAFFERRYVFPSSVDREKVKAKFDEKERILTIEVPKKPDAFKTTNIMIE
jgi:HSP20 family molecular chaperone IbpA